MVWKSINEKKCTYSILVFLQFAGIFYIFATAEMFVQNTILFITELVGIVLGVWAVFSMKVGNFNISPRIREGSVMKTGGPYRVIRHPMYLAIIITLTPLVYGYYSFWRLVVLLVLIFLLVIKIEIEEKLLSGHFEGYQLYRNKTWKLVPFVY